MSATHHSPQACSRCNPLRCTCPCHAEVAGRAAAWDEGYRRGLQKRPATRLADNPYSAALDDATA